MQQLPGDVRGRAPTGACVFAHYAVSSADNPPVADLLAVVRSQGVSGSARPEAG